MYNRSFFSHPVTDAFFQRLQTNKLKNFLTYDSNDMSLEALIQALKQGVEIGRQELK